MPMANESKRQRYEKTIAQFCLMDDTFMAKVFENNIPGTEILLHTILENDKIKVIKAVGQYAVKNLQGRSVRLDIYAQDEQGRHFNVEVQRLNAGAHIIYVNGARRGEDTPLGRLLHDFFCTEPEEMYNKELAERTRFFKEDEGGVGEMCELMEALAREEALEATREAQIRIAERLLMRGMSVDDTVALTELSKEEVEQIAGRLAQKHSA